VSAYTSGEISSYRGVIYVGSTYDEPLPTAFLDDVLSSNVPVAWIYDNIWQLTARAAARGTDFAAAYGWNWKSFDTSAVAQVRYKGANFTRNTINGSGIMDYTAVDPTRASVLAQAVRPDGTTFPWGVRSRNLTYIGENPFAYMSESDRTVIFSDVLFDLLAPATATRHRALVRLEDVGPDSDPDELMTAARYLSDQRIPFSFGVYPVYVDPKGVNNRGRPEAYTLRDRPRVVKAINYMLDHGGTMLQHGFTHQYSNVANPYNGVSADDFEFYLAHVDAQDYVRLDGPVPEDSQAWALGRIDAGLQQFERAKLPKPWAFEFPHYAASAADYAAALQRYSVRYERSLYFGGQLSGNPIDASHMIGQFFPYVVTDVYGASVIPENLGNYEPEASNNNPPRLAADIIDNARHNLVVRDGFASFFYHPYYGVNALRQIVSGIRTLGYTFVSPTSLVPS
jgi:uncharacterized protein YdaL